LVCARRILVLYWYCDLSLIETFHRAAPTLVVQ
jgi:hypothetical protein